MPGSKCGSHFSEARRMAANAVVICGSSTNGVDMRLSGRNAILRARVSPSTSVGPTWNVNKQLRLYFECNQIDVLTLTSTVSI
jgi:hypothetical protein